ncbi:MAG TPA: hypothetical protein VHY33_09215, partial [Thermoanaerobaculia bacterium]|nr:hypothetical protein [Thermoanaerobaculia bacterium]
MDESFGDLLALSRRALAFIFLGTAVSQLLMLIIGSVISYPVYPLMAYVMAHANRATDVVGTIVNAVCAAVVIWVLSICIRHSDKTVLLARNRTMLETARVVTVIQVFVLGFTFILGEARSLVFVNLANVTQIHFMAFSWLFVLN